MSLLTVPGRACRWLALLLSSWTVAAHGQAQLRPPLAPASAPGPSATATRAPIGWGNSAVGATAAPGTLPSRMLPGAAPVVSPGAPSAMPVGVRPAAPLQMQPNSPRAGAGAAVPTLASPQDLVGLSDTQPVRFEGRTTTLKALRESSTTQVLRRGSAGATQAAWTATVRGLPVHSGPGGQVDAAATAGANSALRRLAEAGGSVPGALLRETGATTRVERCNGVDYTTRSASDKPLTGPQVAHMRQSHIGPGGAVVLNGVCFGGTPGRVRLIGNFPGGQLMLNTPVWRHDVVYAEIPGLTGVASHAVVVQLLDARGVLSNEMAGTWDAPPPPPVAMQSLEVDSARVWDVAQCDTRAPTQSLCRSGLIEVGNIVRTRLDALLFGSPAPGAIGAVHTQVDADRPVQPFHGRDVFVLRAPPQCVAQKTTWSAADNLPQTGFSVTHLDGRTVAVDWHADHCVMYGWALDHDWWCTSNYMSRKTVLSCPVGTALP